MALKARVFISCGQRKNADYLTTITKENVNLMTPELEVAKQISHELTELGFEPYIALEQQTLQGVKEAIFEKLRNSEYFLFIDFRREGLFKEGEICFDSGECRGSLFSHQELAIATFQGLEVLAFQEKKVKKDDGILKFIQANCTPFSDRKKLPSIVASEVRKKWNPKWRNELALARSKDDFKDANNRGVVGRYFHIKVLNRHKDKIARNCVAYIERIKNLTTGKTKAPELVELKWKGVTKESISISPKSFRYLDALHIDYQNPTVAHLGLNPFLVDWEGYVQEYRIIGSGDYEIDYVIFSEDFTPARARFRLHIGTQIEEVEFKKTS